MEDIRRGIGNLCSFREVKSNTNRNNKLSTLGVSGSRIPSSNQAISTNSSFTLVIYQRNLNRKFKDLTTLVMKLWRNITTASNALHMLKNPGSTNTSTNSTVIANPFQWRIHVVHHHDELHPCWLHEVLSNADMLLTAHGFQNTG